MKKIESIYEKYKEIINYLIFGILTTIVSLLVYYISVYTFLNPKDALQLQIANILSWVAGVTFAYITNRKYVFESKEKNKLKEASKFVIARIITLLIDMGIMFIGVTILHFNDKIMKLVSQRPGGAKRYTGMSNEMLLKLWDLFIKEYTGINNKEELNKYEQKLKFYALIRSMPGITFSELVPKEGLIKLTKEVSDSFLKGYDIMSNSLSLKKDKCNK